MEGSVVDPGLSRTSYRVRCLALRHRACQARRSVIRRLGNVVGRAHGIEAVSSFGSADTYRTAGLERDIEL
jgi:hypothetical protein